jgi:hypothetical protein
MDFQALYPTDYVPKFIAGMPHWYFSMSKDPFLGGALGLVKSDGMLWFKSFVALEV